MNAGDAKLMEIHDALWPLANEIGGAIEMNAIAFRLLAKKIEAAGKRVEDFTLGEMAALIEENRQEFNALYQGHLEKRAAEE